MSTTPAPAGEMAVTDVGVLAVMVANLVPKLTAVAPARFTPVTVTTVPPPVDPWFGEIGMRCFPFTLNGCAFRMWGIADSPQPCLCRGRHDRAGSRVPEHGRASRAVDGTERMVFRRS